MEIVTLLIIMIYCVKVVESKGKMITILIIIFSQFILLT